MPLIIWPPTVFLQKIVIKTYFVIDVNDIHCLSSKSLGENNFMKCPHNFDENTNFQCALRNAQMLKTFFCGTFC